MRYPLPQIEELEYEWSIHGHTLILPWTFLRKREADELFRLVAEGPGCGAIVNVGHFFGGSAIILAKDSQTNNRERVFSFDRRAFERGNGFAEKNGVEDRLVFSVSDSVAAARKWSDRGDTAIRLLLIDGDHSFEGCRADLEAWLPFLVTDGVVAVHDYCSEHSFILPAVYDCVLKRGEFGYFRREETLFLADRLSAGKIRPGRFVPQ